GRDTRRGEKEPGDATFRAVSSPPRRTCLFHADHATIKPSHPKSARWRTREVCFFELRDPFSRLNWSRRVSRRDEQSNRRQRSKSRSKYVVSKDCQSIRSRARVDQNRHLPVPWEASLAGR